MHILVNAIPLIGLGTGISRYLRALYSEIARIPGIKVSYFNGKKVLGKMPPPASPDLWIRQTSMIWKLPDPVVMMLRSLDFLKYEYNLRRAVRSGRYDLYHETGFVPAKLTGIPMVYSIYDLSLIRFREHHPRERVWFFDTFISRRLRYASHILTISQFIESEIHTILKIHQDHVSSVHLAPNTLFYRRSRGQVTSVLKRLNLPKSYFLFVGSLEPRKNMRLIIRAMQLQENPLPLVLAGWAGWGEKSWLEEVKQAGLDRYLFMTGYIDDETLAGLYSGAQALVYPSVYEGFGLPVVEAMSSGCPVICSSAASLPEVAGKAAWLVDPHNPDELAAALDQLVSDPDLREGMVQKGSAQAKKYSWQKTAQQTLSVFYKTKR